MLHKHDNQHVGPRRRSKSEPRSKPDAVLARILAAGGDPEPKRPTAHQLLLRFGSLAGIARTPTEQLLLLGSLTPQDLDLLEALGDMVGLIDDDDDRQPVIHSSLALHAYLVERHSWPSVGTTARAILFDHTRQLVGDVEIEHGLAPATAAHVLVKEMLQRRAAGVVMVRMQASERSDLSEEFRATLQAISRALHLVGVTLMQVAVATPTDLFPVDVASFSPHSPA